MAGSRPAFFHRYFLAPSLFSQYLIVDHLLPLDSVTNCPMEPVLYYLGLLLDKNMAVIPCNNSDRIDVQCLEDRGGGAENEAT